MALSPLNKFGLSKRDGLTIENILKKYHEVTEVVIFGSRAKGNYKPGSDIDLAIINKEVDNELLAKIKNDFSESSLPYMVDIVLFKKIINPDFMEHIERVGLPFYKKNS